MGNTLTKRKPRPEENDETRAHKKPKIIGDATTPTTSTSATPRDVSGGPSSEFHKYDVFISYRGEDTRRNFTSHLYAALCDKKIKTYKDDVSLPRGDEISPALYQAIENLKISIVVFSRDYASSRWCLDELVHILKCKRERDQVVLPVFYGVDPSHVRKQSGSFGSAFVEHERRFEAQKVAQWRSALLEASNLSGWDSSSKDHGSESQLVKEIAQVTVSQLSSIYSITSDHDTLENSPFVGLEERLNELEPLLCDDPLHVRVVGLWGMGGIGKSTLAKAAMKRLSSGFESSFFVDVSDEVTKHGSSHLKKKIFATSLNDETVDTESSLSDARLRCTKVCLVLDNVSEQELLECLNENRVPYGGHRQIKSRFGAGSVIILTSRDKKLLTEMTDFVYEVEALDMHEAARLFHKNAFEIGSLSKVSEYTELSNRVVAYCGGNPLALNVLGCYLYSRTVREWESALIELEKTPNEKIQRVLKISYDALNSAKQSLFLDIACFFKGEKRQIVEDTLGGEACVGISVLIEECLVSIEGDNKLQMHDLIQEMGRELGKSSRLWDAKDVCSVLKRPTGSACIEGISLNMSNVSQDLHLKPTVFEPMENLRILKINRNYRSETKSILLHQGLEHLPHLLQYLEWECYPLKTLPMDFDPQNLVSVQMRRSNLEKLWNGVVHLGNLKYIDLRHSSFLVELPDLSKAPKLETVNLWYCKSLLQFPKLSNSTKNIIMTDSKVENIDSSLESLEHLYSLNLSSHNMLKTLPNLPENLTILRLSFTNFKTMPPLKHMSKLKWLILEYCKSLEYLKDLPSSLRLLDVSCCKSLKTIDASACTLLNGVGASGCKSLTHFNVSESVSGLNQLQTSWSEVFPYDDEENNLWNSFEFSHCNKLKPRMQQSIWTLLKRTQLGMTYTLLNDLLTAPDTDMPRGRACYPGDEIPKQFDQQSEGSNIIVRLPHGDSNIGFGGFFVSVLLTLDRRDRIPDFEGLVTVTATVRSTCNDRNTSSEFGGMVYWCCELDQIKHNRDHVVMWFIHFRVPHEEALLEFEILHLSGYQRFKIKRCGICTVPLLN